MTLWMVVRRLLAWFAVLVFCLSAQAQDGGCAPRILAVQAARSADGARPAQGFEDVALPDVWTARWPRYDGSVWYRIDWERGCATEPAGLAGLALGLDGIVNAGEVFINDDLLWRDASLAEPLSRSWNVPRWWLLPASTLRAGANTVWVHVVGVAALSPGLGALRVGDAASVARAQGQAQWRQRTVYFVNAVLAGMAAALFLLVWGLRRESTYGWFALMSLCWLAYLSTYLADTPWPFADSLARARASLVALIGYVLCACLFTFRFGAQRLPWAERALWLLAAAGAAAAWLAPQHAAAAWFSALWQGAMAVFLLNGLQFQWHAWRPGRQAAQRLLALCWLALVAVALFALDLVPDVWQVARSWAALSGIVTIALVMLLLGGQLAQQMRSAERFQRALEARVAEARAELAQASAREHTQALQNAKLQERMQIAHDLHDGLGASLVRGMALLEQAPGPLPGERVLSLLKTLRDDLRQVIDHGSSAGAEVPETPVQWAAPLRHRFTLILDEMGVATEWHIAPVWQVRPSALQCLLLTRLAEEALSNVLKHSQARRVRVECGQPVPGVFAVCIEDDGRGFDVEAVRRAGLSVGMRSMAARAERMGATLKVESGAGGTVVSVVLLLDQ
jgi:signal transduction histidine kinase